MPLTLYTTKQSKDDTDTVLIAAAVAGVELKVETLKTVHDKTPHNKGPVLETGEGLVWSSDAIIRYVARNTPASGDSPLATAHIDQWIAYTVNELIPPRGLWLLPVKGKLDFDNKVYNQAKKNVTKVLKTFDKHLSTRTYFVGHVVTIADVVVYTALTELVSTVFSPNYLKSHVNLIRWLNTLAHNPAFEGVLGELVFATEEKKAKKKAQPKKQQPKKEQKQQQKAKPKPKHPLLALPKSSMILDVVKKLFFNQKPFNPKFWEDFWPQYDAAGYSFHRFVYQYNEENKEFWRTQNQLGMYLQRLDAARKWSFASMMINGATEDSGPWVVEGVILVRGTEKVPQEVMDVPDSEYYKFTKLDHTADKALIEAFYTGDDIEGRKVLDRRYFK